MTVHSTVEILPDESHLAEAAADRFIGIVEATLRYRQIADVALAGGSTPRAMNALLAASPRRSHVPWDRVRFFFGDERCVPPDDPESNYRMTRETLFDPLGIPPEHVFRVHGEDDPQTAAETYADVLTRELGSRPRFDLLYLGMGPDGHTASIFPGTFATIDDSKLVVANWVEKFKTWRITLTPHVINDATHVVITAGGASKADALHAVLDGPYKPDSYPIQLVAPQDGELHWFIDEAAGAKLVRRPAAEARSSSGSRH
jgi:6-phosphogluconolactonase